MQCSHTPCQQYRLSRQSWHHSLRRYWAGQWSYSYSCNYALSLKCCCSGIDNIIFVISGGLRCGDDDTVTHVHVLGICHAGRREDCLYRFTAVEIGKLFCAERPTTAVSRCICALERRRPGTGYFSNIQERVPKAFVCGAVQPPSRAICD